MAQSSSVIEQEMSNLQNLRPILANTIRGLSMDAVQRANSGHPGMPMGMADAAAVLWSQFLKHNPADPHWPDRDRFVLSAGHGSMLLYSLLHLAGYDLPLEELKQFRQWESKTPGHPEYRMTAGVETTTGPLGQGISNSVGMALAERHLAARFNRPGYDIIDHHTYVIASDGDLQEGVSHESCALAGHWGLGKLVVLYDDNNITIDGPASLSFSEDVLKRFEAYGWHTQRVNGHDMQAVESAIKAAHAATDRPSIIACKTIIGFGSPNKAGTASAHGEPLGQDEVNKSKEQLGLPLEPAFYIPDEMQAFREQTATRGSGAQQEWQERFDRYKSAHPELAAQLEAMLRGDLPDGWEQALPEFPLEKAVATRAASGTVIEKLMPRVSLLVGGSADLTPSNKTQPKDLQPLSRDNFEGRYIHFGVREHGMGSIMNGMLLHGGIRPFGGTFLIFSDYMRPAIRLAAIMEIPVIYVLTHDSIGLGEDGPTHQPIEHLAALRVIPDLFVFRPADATETVEAWRAALMRKNGPSVLALTRQNLPVFDRTRFAPAEGVQKGGYVLVDVEDPQVILMGAGSEVHLAVEAQKELSGKGIRARVVSMPCLDLFESQPEAYREQVLPSHIRARVAVEAGAMLSWQRYVAPDGIVIGLNTFGASAPYEIIYEERGITAEAVVNAAEKLAKA